MLELESSEYLDAIERAAKRLVDRVKTLQPTGIQLPIADDEDACMWIVSVDRVDILDRSRAAPFAS